MTAFFNSNRFLRRAGLAAGVVVLCLALLAGAVARPDEPLADSVGVIDGEAITLTGPMRVEAVNGEVKTILRSGSEIRVKSGSARIDLVEGGQISICGPAHLSVLKSPGSLTVALDTGTVHVRIEHEPTLTIHTPQIQAQAVAIGDGPQDVLVGFETPGAMCIRANRGAVRLEQQFTGQSLLVPQAGDVVLLNGQLDTVRNSAGHCTCELQVTKAIPPPQPEMIQVATVGEVGKRTFDARPNLPLTPVERTTVKEEPIYQVILPPLIYDPKAKIQAEVDPRMIVLVRRVRVRPTLIFQGRVEGEAVAAVTPPPKPAAVVTASASKPSAPANDSFVARMRKFVSKLWSRGS